MIKQQEDDNYSVIDKIYLIQMKQNMNILLKHLKTMISNDWKSQRFLLNIQIICSMSIKTLKSQAFNHPSLLSPPPPHPPKKNKNKCKVLIVFNGMAAAMISSEKLNQIVTELFVKGSQRFYRTILFCSTKGF